MKYSPSKEADAGALPKLQGKVFVQSADIEIILPREGMKKKHQVRAPKQPCPKDSLAQKELLTLREAAAYTGIGINRLRRMSNDEDCSFVLWVGSKRMLKRRELEKYLAEAYSV